MDSDKSIQVVAEEWDMFPETMFAINCGGILGKHPHGENFSEYTLIDRLETVDWERSRGEEDVLDGSDEDAARTSTGGGGGGQTTQTPAATSSRRSSQSRTGFFRLASHGVVVVVKRGNKGPMNLRSTRGYAQTWRKLLWISGNLYFVIGGRDQA